MEGLRIKRLIKHLSQVELASLLGVTAASVINWEKGKSVPPWKTLAKLSEFFGCEIKELF